jgi:hypothetical protein
MKDFLLTQEQPHLIAFDSSFTPEKQTKADILGTEFERLWNLTEESIFSARGWCDASVDNVVILLQKWDPQHVEVIPANVPPIIGNVFFFR